MSTIRMKQVIGAGIVTVALFICAATVFAFSFGKYEKVKVINGAAIISVDKLADGKAHFYKFEDGGKEIVFLRPKRLMEL